MYEDCERDGDMRESICNLSWSEQANWVKSVKKKSSEIE